VIDKIKVIIMVDSILVLLYKDIHEFIIDKNALNFFALFSDGYS
jgi:hypothetical protein